MFIWVKPGSGVRRSRRACLRGRVVVVVQVVQAGDGQALIQELFGEVVADEAGCTSD